MDTAERTSEIRIPRRRGPGVYVIIATIGAVVIAGGLALTLRDNGSEAGRPEAVAAGDTPATTVGGPASTAPPPTTATTAPVTTLPPRLGSDSRLTPDGIGPVRVGMTFSEASAAAGMTLELLSMSPTPGCRHATPAESSGLRHQLAFMLVDDRIVRVEVSHLGGNRTLSGVGVGSTEAEVQATYPGQIRAEPHEYVRNGRNLVYVPNDPAFSKYGMLFETVDGRVRAMRAGAAGPVMWPEGCV